jgi:hypothetical protein
VVTGSNGFAVMKYVDVCPQVLKIERVQHARLWRRYALKRSELEDTRGRQGEACGAMIRIMQRRSNKVH